MSKELKKIFLVLGLYSLAGGLLYNFQELWLINNNLSVSTIGVIYSLSAMLTVSVIFLCSNIITTKHLKKFTILLLLIKGIVILLLFLLNQTGYNVAIKFLIMLDYVTDVELYACIYPLITTINKTDKIFAARGIAYSVFYYLGVILTTFTLGTVIGNTAIDYNSFVLAAAIFIFIAALILTTIKIKTPKVEKNETTILNQLYKKISSDKITKNFLAYHITGMVSYYTLTSLTLILFTEHLGMTPTTTSNILLVVGILSVIIATIILAKVKIKNNYAVIFIKFGIRILLILLVIIFKINIFIFLSIIYIKLLVDSYEHVTDAPYVNRFPNKFQLAFCNLLEMAGFFGRSLGTLFCGLTLDIDVRYTYIIAIVFAILQVYFAVRARRLLDCD